MRGKYFLDTNIFIYSFDDSDLHKHNLSKALIKEALLDLKGSISYQVIQEFINVAMQKFKRPMHSDDCKHYIDKFMAPICEITSSVELFKSAIDIKDDYQLSFYDSLIVAAAIKSNSKILYSEDLTHGQKNQKRKNNQSFSVKNICKEVKFRVYLL